MRVAMIPDWRAGNPYQELLARNLQGVGDSVAFSSGYRRGLPISRALLSGDRPDLLHLHWPSAYLRSAHPLWRRAYLWRTLFDLWLIRRAGIPIIWTVHNLVTHDTPTPGPETRFSRRLAHLADHLIVHSAAAREQIVATFRVPADKIAIIPHGSFHELYGAAPIARRRAPRWICPATGRLCCFSA